MSAILEHPEAQELLDQTEVEPNTVRQCARRLTQFLQRYLPFFYRDEQRQHAQIILQGKLTGLQRKTTEPIAIEADLKRRPLQHFVGAGVWDDDAVLSELRRHVHEELGDAESVLVLDPSAFPKKGGQSVGSPGNGADAGPRSTTLGRVCSPALRRTTRRAAIDCRLFLPEEPRPPTPQHRQKTYVPPEVAFAEKWRDRPGVTARPAKKWPMAGSWATTSSVA